MAQPFVGEIRMFGGNYAPLGWAFCNGALLPVSEYSALFQLIGTSYGGDGQNTFALPDLQGRLPVCQGQGAGLSNYVIGSKAGAETVTLTTAQLPTHTHGALGSSSGPASSPAGATWGNNNLPSTFSPGSTAIYTMAPGSIGMNAGGQPHDNLMPFLVISFIISLYGTYPTQS